HRPAGRGRARRGARARPLGAHGADDPRARAVCGAAAAPPRVVPRPRAHRADLLRRLPRARRWRRAARPLASGARRRTQARRRGPVRRLMAVARVRAAGALDVDAATLAQELRAAIEGEVRFSAGDRALYSATGSNYRQLPIGVV